MELDILDEDKAMDDIKVISYDSKDQRDDSEHSDVSCTQEVVLTPFERKLKSFAV